MAVVLYAVGVLGFVGAIVLGVFRALGHLRDTSFALIIVAAVNAVLLIGLGRALELLRSIDQRLGQNSKTSPPPPADDTRLPTEPRDEPQRFRYADFRIDAFDDGTYVVRGPGMKPRRFKNQDALDDFLDRQA